MKDCSSVRRIKIATVALLALVVAAPLAWPGTLPFYLNIGTTNDPVIDATAVLNQGRINDNVTFSSVPFDTSNTRFFTNSSSGVMQSLLRGFRFDFQTNSVRLPAATFVNRGLVSGASRILINSTNVTNSGSLLVAPTGLIRIEGQSVSLRRGAVGAAAAFPSWIAASGRIFTKTPRA
jgi:hypothetical protein